LDKANVIQRLQKVKAQIKDACTKAKINSCTINLLAVSKTHPSIMIQWAFEGGQIEFGENYVQEANAKQKELAQIPIQWHFIGQLQKNKVKNVVGAFALIHSVDSLELAQKISQKARELNIQQKILLEVNLGNEESKGGFHKSTVTEQFAVVCTLPNLELSGLMALPPLFDDPEQTRPYFRELRNLFDNLKTTLPKEQQSGWKFLSMGTTHDFPVAIEEGANIVRVGTAIFGERPAKPQRTNA
jgi:pyridoxal phosphate enzyme (YggS family)